MDRCLDWLRGGIERLRQASATRRAEAELRALDSHELRDIGLDPGGIHHAVRHGRADLDARAPRVTRQPPVPVAAVEANVPAPKARGMRPDGFNVRGGP